jgi:hypothetical protein
MGLAGSLVPADGTLAAYTPGPRHIPWQLANETTTLQLSREGTRYQQCSVTRLHNRFWPGPAVDASPARLRCWGDSGRRRSAQGPLAALSSRFFYRVRFALNLESGHLGANRIGTQLTP